MPKPPRKPLEPWQKEDAKRLRAIWDKRPEPQISQGTFAAEAGIGETQGIIWQYMNGRIPLNLKAAIKFARGLNCPVSDISPTLAQQLIDGGELPTEVIELAQKILQLNSDEQKLLLKIFSKAAPNEKLTSDWMNPETRPNRKRRDKAARA